VNNAFPEPTSTDNDAVPDTENGNWVAFRRAPAAGAGFTAADATDGTTVTPTTPAAAKAATVNAEENIRARHVNPITGLAFRKTHGKRQGPINDRGHHVPGPHLPGQAVNLCDPAARHPNQRTVASLATTTKTTNASMDPGGNSRQAYLA